MNATVIAIIPGGGPPTPPPPSNVPEVSSVGLLLGLVVVGGAYRLIRSRKSPLRSTSPPQRSVDQ